MATKQIQVGTQLRVTTSLERKDSAVLSKVTWIVKAEVTKVTATEIEWKTIEVVAFTAHGEDAPVSGVIAKVSLPLLRKAGRVEIL